MPDRSTNNGPRSQARHMPELAVDGVYASLGSSPAGLTEAEADARLLRHGPNTLRQAPGTPILLKLAANFTHLMALLLWAGGAIAFVAGMPQLGVAVWMVNLINGVFSFWQEYKAERALEREPDLRGMVVAGGVAGTRIQTISYGKDRPESLGSNEQAWAQNRRAVTVIR